MKRVQTLVSCGLVLLLTAACSQPTGEPSASAPAPSPVDRGAYLVKIAACNDCHTPWVNGPNGPEPDMTRMLSGHPENMPMAPPPALDPSTGWMWAGAATNTAFAGPWGVSYAINLTPDQNTGLGIWTEDMFVRAIREGKHMATSRPILPPMPWPMYRNMTDDDLKAVYAYLRSIPPVTNHVPDAVVAAPPQ